MKSNGRKVGLDGKFREACYLINKFPPEGQQKKMTSITFSM